MTLTARRILALGLVPLLAPLGSAWVEEPTRLLAAPDLDARHIVFLYAEDLWVCDRDGSHPRRLTSHEGRETNARLSPDGHWVAFSGEYDGNTDVYLVSVHGGAPKRLTYHPGADVVQDFTPDGTAVLFSSGRQVYTGRHQQLYTIPVQGGQPERLPIPHAFQASVSPSGDKIAYTPLYEAFRQWKNYRGGTATRIWIYDVATQEVDQVPQPEGRCNDTVPLWIGEHVYFLSDRAGEFNLFRFTPGSDSVQQRTFHEDFPILSAQTGDGALAYEQAGWLHVHDPESGATERVNIAIATDDLDRRSRFVEGTNWIRNADISPSGKRAVFECRGEIVTVPAEHGDPRNLTSTPGAHERSPAWSPDGQWIAYFSDASGEYELCVARQDGSGTLRKFSLPGAGFYDSPKFSPDSKKLSFLDNSWSLYCIDLESGDCEKIASEPVYGPLRTTSHAWSPDSRWIVYTLTTSTYFQRVHLYELATKQSLAITDGLADVSEPVFDASGKYLWFTASTDAGPVRSWFAMSNADMEMTNQLYLAVLQRGEPSPLAPRSDEEEETSESAESDATDSEASAAEGNADEPSLRIDAEGLASRILTLPLGSAFHFRLVAGKDGQLYFLRAERGSGLFGFQGSATLQRFDLASREATTIADGVSDYRLSSDGSKLLLQRGSSWSIANAGPGASGDRLNLSAISLRIDPAAEWRQIYDEAWRINRDYFYDPNFHGCDWEAMHAKYEVFLPDVGVRSDLNRVIQWMCSELAVGHHRVGGGDSRRDRPDRVSGGLLGADFEIDSGRYRFQKVFGGLNWDPRLRAPLSEPGVEVEAGEYLLAVNGVDLVPPQNLFARFENSAGRQIEITVGPNPDGEGARTLTVVPVGNEQALRNRDWVEDNIRKVHEATDGRVAYVYVPNTTSMGHVYFKRYFFPQAGKDAIIIDERHNGGGQIADYYIDHLRRPFLCHWAMRYGADLPTPLSSIQGPKVMLIDETAGSGGDMLPWMFRQLDLGTLIGRPTWGGLVGTLGFPVLMDGGSVTAPNLAIWTEDGFIVENVGVPPDIEVEQLPADVAAGRDPQLEKAIEVVLEQLETNPPATHQRPAFPKRAR